MTRHQKPHFLLTPPLLRPALALFAILASTSPAVGEEGARALVFSQFVEGAVEGFEDIENSTTIALRNNGDETIKGQVLFRDGTGNPVEVPLQDRTEPASSVDFQLPPFGVAFIETSGVSNPALTGSAEVIVTEGDAAKLDGTLLISFLGKAVSVQNSEIRRTHQAIAVISEGSRGALALFNPDPDTASTSSCILLNDDGSRQATKSVTVEPLQRVSVFLDEEPFFATLLGGREEFLGTVNCEVTSGPAIASTGLVLAADGSLLAISTSANAFVDSIGNGVVEFAEQQIFFEFNSTDLDLGIHIFLDAEGWKKVEVRGPAGKVFEVTNAGELNEIGSTEVFTESAEPPLVEDPETAAPEEIDQAIAAFLARFPEGEYQFTGRTVEGAKLMGNAELSHDLPVPVSLNLDGFPFIDWSDESEADDPDIVGYQVVVELVAEQDDEERVFLDTADFPATQTSYTASPEFVNLIEQLQDSDELVELKVEVIAIGKDGNKTITEEIIIEEEDEG